MRIGNPKQNVTTISPTLIHDDLGKGTYIDENGFSRPMTEEELRDGHNAFSHAHGFWADLWERAKGFFRAISPEKPIEDNPSGHYGDLGGDRGCFPAGTLISTPRGPVPIEKIRPGDIVLSFNPGCGVPKKAKRRRRVRYRGIRP